MGRPAVQGLDRRSHPETPQLPRTPLPAPVLAQGQGWAPRLQAPSPGPSVAGLAQNRPPPPKARGKQHQGGRMIPINRLVALLTPVFAAAAVVGSAWLLKHFPGLPFPSTAELTAVEALGATTAGAAALKWLHGHQKWEERVADAENIAGGASHRAP